MRETRHESLNAFVGMCFDHGKTVIDIWGHCQRGALQDILFDEAINLDMMFKSSIMRDVIRGLEYLHLSPIGFHGRLNTGTCMVDGKWQVKLSEFGINKIMEPLIMANSITGAQLTDSGKNK